MRGSIFLCHVIESALKIFLFCVVLLYRTFIIKPAVCRHHPTCSSYAMEALKEFNIFFALFIITKRILRCHPWTTGDCIDYIPKKTCAKISPNSRAPAKLTLENLTTYF